MSSFRENFWVAIRRYPIVTVHMDDDEVIRIGSFDTSKDQVFPRPNGFYIERGASVVWYSYAHIKKIEAFGNEYQRKDPFNG